uniref:Uncharacterized protein n=1 Tax=Rhizophora mucronata TaxID=61149 RepID=A0A2P2J1U2_RHIMU
MQGDCWKIYASLTIYCISLSLWIY